VKDSAVVAGLMLSYRRFFLENGDLGVRKTLSQAKGGAQSDDSAAHYCDLFGAQSFILVPQFRFPSWAAPDPSGLRVQY
jgi:hypothetical protein